MLSQSSTVTAQSASTRTSATQSGLISEGGGASSTWDSRTSAAPACPASHRTLMLAAATGCGVFAWSRVGYGRSSPAKLPRTLDFMHVEAREILPRLLDAIGFREGLLVGHSDGASIAAIYGGAVQDHRVRGLVLMAPHFIVEDVTINSIREIRHAFDTTDVRQRFQRWHADADATVRGWTDVWLTNDFHAWDLTGELAYIRVPVLIIQGDQDNYGTVRQIEIAQEECYCPVEVLLMPGIKHVPHREVPEQTLRAIADFSARLLREHEGAVAAATR